jgi:peptide/nickel transport system ATP-binding protein
LRLNEPTGGRILLGGSDLAMLNASELKRLRAHIQLIFQDPYSSLNPRMTIGAAIAEVLKVHKVVTRMGEVGAIVTGERGQGNDAGLAKGDTAIRGQGNDAVREQVIALLEKVSLKAEHFDRYPHEFSGGQRQRIVIARALALRPSFIVCDESVSALDVSVQAQVLNLLNDLKKEFGFTVVFISHDLAVIRYISDRIMVMNKGRIEEVGIAEEVYTRPASPYTKRLIAAIPRGL